MQTLKFQVEIDVPDAEDHRSWQRLVSREVRKALSSLIVEESAGTVSPASAPAYVRVRPLLSK